jgi:hypothetical protein
VLYDERSLPKMKRGLPGLNGDFGENIPFMLEKYRQFRCYGFLGNDKLINSSKNLCNARKFESNFFRQPFQVLVQKFKMSHL